jgi:hypothetical protein
MPAESGAATGAASGDVSTRCQGQRPSRAGTDARWPPHSLRLRQPAMAQAPTPFAAGARNHPFQRHDNGTKLFVCYWSHEISQETRGSVSGWEVILAVSR